jgi:NAD(P)-dependent dehydrogenase (short-subunit alcohol dehydrogenase family)
MKRVLVTGGSGKLGRACVRDLVEHGLQVFNADTVPSKDNLCPFRQVNFEDMAHPDAGSGAQRNGGPH